jgi:PEP-CTERM motif
MGVSKFLFANLIVAVLGASPASADAILFSSFGPNDSFNQGSGTFFGFVSARDEGEVPSRFARAMAFTPTATNILESVELALEYPAAFNEGPLVVNLFSANGELPGALLETFTFDSRTSRVGVFAFDSAAHPRLINGVTYFLEATTKGVTTGNWWDAPDSLSEPVPDVFRRDNGAWEVAGTRDFIAAFRVTGASEPVPEPASIILLATGVGFAGWRRRMRASGNKSALGE